MINFYRKIAFIITLIFISNATYSQSTEIKIKFIGIYHLYPNEKINNLSPEKIILLDKQGEVITIPY